ncbi:hypothetical protein HK107_07350 [Parvularcula sp. ZS-1/3]|uniref:Uncharacterized protein n=1 Tax=Parvularcula mediterranea TaxID=2732508 RepID=A0A7Y3RM73_9PROT|nr:hypothetical protein [Parvularcula mediterranea]NNU16136.1 hypothetical protein [Parvularcula mediterranea]
MQSFNDAQKLREAKRAYQNVLFRNETIRNASSPVALCALFLTLAAALPGALLLQKRSEEAQQVPYLEIAISGEPERISPATGRENLNNGQQ